MSGQPKRSSKSILFEYCQKRKIGPPYFENWAATSGYQAKVMIDGYPYPTSGVFGKKKDAEHDAAKACLASLGIYEEDGHGGQGDPERGIEGSPRNGRSSFATPSPRQFDGPFATPSPRPFDRPQSVGGSSGGSVKMPKSVLHEFCQSQKMSLPQYETEASYDGNMLLGFHCVLVVKDEYFTTDRLFTNKREAEHAVARKALNVFGYYTRTPLYTGTVTTRTPPSGSPSFQSPQTSYKNILQEHLQQRNIETPDYETQLADGGYFSQVTIEGKVFKAEECCQTKKQAEQTAAKAGLIGMGVKDPEAVARRLLGLRGPRGEFRSPGAIPYMKSLPEVNNQDTKTWVHTRQQSGFDIDDYDDIDGEFVDFQKAAPVKVLKRSHDESVDEDDFFGEPGQRPHKMQRVAEGSENNSRPSSEKRPLRRGEFEVEEMHLGNLTVGEAWPEKRNIVIVGSAETSIPLFCQGDMERCALEDLSAGTLVDIVPGHRLVGLEGHYVLRGGQIVLRARQCQQVVMPDEPDKVLISCGVVVLHCIPRRNGNETSCGVNVLLKRYLCSQAFINVVRGLCQYFRNKVTDRPFTLNKDLMVAHIKDWMLEEVMAISSFSETAIENVFEHTTKFDKRWIKYLKDDQLSKELREIQVAANEELFRRANSGEDQNQDRFRPWRLPKGNFNHRVLTTGVFIESPAEAAMRELKEETGIKLKLADISSSPYVDISQSDNLNPHKGDVARYYLCGIITEVEGETQEENLAQEPPAGNPDTSSTATDSALAGSYSAPQSTDQSDGGTYSAPLSTNPGSYSAQTGTHSAQPGTYSTPFNANSTPFSTNSASIPFISDSTQTSTDKAPFTTPSTPFNADSAQFSADSATLSTNSTSRSPDAAPAKELTSITETDTPDKSESKEESMVIRSPFVAGAVHEECKWFDMEEAIEISSIFQEIHRSHEFQKLLAKLKGIVSTM